MAEAGGSTLDHPDAARSWSVPPPQTAATVREAAFSLGACTTVGRRLLQWAEAAGMQLAPPAAAFDPTFRFSKDPGRYKQLYRRCCVQSRSAMDRLADPSAIGAVLRSCDASVRDDHARGGESASRSPSRGPQRTDSNVLQQSGPGANSGLRQVRLQREYSLWCKWQVVHFFDKPSSYISNVWRHLQNSPAMENPSALSGRYVIPSDTKLTTLVAAAEHERRRLRYFTKLLREEFGLREEDVDGGDAANTSQRAHSVTVSDAGAEEDDRGEAESTLDEAISGSHRASRLAATQPFLEVRYDAETARLHLSVYTGGEGDEGEGATFFGKSTAACLDNFRWIVLEGLWNGRILFFVPQFAYSPVKEVTHAPSGHDQVVIGIDSLIVQGMSWKKITVPQSASAPTGPYVCMRCGNLRVQRHNARVPPRSDPQQRDRLLCVLCRRKTCHVKAPERYPAARDLLRRRLACIPDGDVDDGGAVPYHPGYDTTYVETGDRSMAVTATRPSREERIRDAYLEAVHQLTYGTVSHRKPAWRRCRNVDHRALFVPYSSLGFVPAKPKLFKRKYVSQ
ncbi:hypothetical protein STCU_06026 [Strigomonas culicis]|uniref:Uncharacterized protein n=1 Tax=Strigomonas culicis TaxID=28005 RepID=S9U818_9TRYP|nr:hypothetical protein STCU_06026 [Strigomonas culicis]|eukprot:EPY26892.1 hypothetical protein STCU_06026 [Strigomonas culicis]